MRREYLKATKDPWFTNAELWRVLRGDPEHEGTIILHAHINQQTYANLTQSGQSTHERDEVSLASFNLELQRRKPFASSDLHATLTAPKNQAELFESAPVKFHSLGIELLEKLSVEDVVSVRRRAEPLFSVARSVIRTEVELENLRLKYIKALETYWGFIVDSFERRSKEKLFRPRRTALFVEQHMPPLDRIQQDYGNGIFAVLWRVASWKLGPFSSVLSPVAGAIGNSHLGALLVQERTPENYALRAAVPPPEWYPSTEWSSRGILGLSASPVDADEARTRAEASPKPLTAISKQS